MSGKKLEVVDEFRFLGMKMSKGVTGKAEIEDTVLQGGEN